MNNKKMVYGTTGYILCRHPYTLTDEAEFLERLKSFVSWTGKDFTQHCLVVRKEFLTELESKDWSRAWSKS